MGLRLGHLKIALLLTTALVMLSPQVTLTQGETNSQLFTNGFVVDGVFLEAYNRFGGLEILGYPITQPFVDQGLMVQYFQRARLEWHPDNPEPYQVQLGLLGEELHYRRPPVAQPHSLSHRKVYFPETGHSIAYAFLDFFRAHGGIDTFGYPITEVLREEGKVVQYFQRLKMVWYPEVLDSKVQTADLGEVYIQYFRDRMSPEMLAPPDGRLDTSVTALQLAVSLERYVLSPGQNQTISVLVMNQNRKHQPLALLSLSLETVDGLPLAGSVVQLTSDENGLAVITLPIRELEQGMRVVVRVVARHNGLTEEIQTSFLLW